MSEIKGQLLGILLVISIFAAISGVLIGSYTNAANNVTDKIEETSLVVSA